MAPPQESDFPYFKAVLFLKVTLNMSATPFNAKAPPNIAELDLKLAQAISKVPSPEAIAPPTTAELDSKLAQAISKVPFSEAIAPPSSAELDSKLITEIFKVLFTE